MNSMLDNMNSLLNINNPIMSHSSSQSISIQFEVMVRAIVSREFPIPLKENAPIQDIISCVTSLFSLKQSHFPH